MSNPHPYQGLPAEAFWKQAVGDVNPLDLTGLYEPRFALDLQTRIAAAGSCFAQHIGRQFKERGYHFVDVEPAPGKLPAERRREFGYDLYSARYGNVYSARQLVQLFARASGDLTPVEEVWQDEDGFWDPLRPAIEPEGFASLEELRVCRDAHLEAVASILPNTDVFVFTFGLTEAWVDRRDGTVYPACPGTVRGTFDPELHAFVNFGWPQVMEDFEEFMAIARRANPHIRFLVTVSPVPLTATASGRHVLAATMTSKSILRAVCAELYERYDFVDYFPSYELVASHPMRAMFFEPNLRSVSPTGVAHVMEHFFGSGTAATRPGATAPGTSGAQDSDAAPARDEDDEEVVCEDAILAQFGS